MFRFQAAPDRDHALLFDAPQSARFSMCHHRNKDYRHSRFSHGTVSRSLRRCRDFAQDADACLAAAQLRLHDTADTLRRRAEDAVLIAASRATGRAYI